MGHYCSCLLPRQDGGTSQIQVSRRFLPSRCVTLVEASQYISYFTRRKSHHEAEILKAVSGSGLDAPAAAAASSGVERLLPEDFDTARPRPNVVLIMCDDQGK